MAKGTANDGQPKPEDESPIQLFHHLVETTKKHMQTSLSSAANASNFHTPLKGPTVDDLRQRATPINLDEAVKRSALGITVLQNNPLDTNEANAAVQSFLVGLVMQEAETSIREVVDNAEKEERKMEQDKTDDSMAESAAVAGAFSSSKEKTQGRKLNFNITEEEFDISFSPSEDPNCYKPIEIISYMGMTN